MTDCRVNRDTNDHYTRVEQAEAKMAANEQEEQERVDEIVDRLMGGDDPDLLAEVLNETPWCVKLLSELCEFETGISVAGMTDRELVGFACAAKRLVESIQDEVKKGVEAGHYP